jgi:hypothetical protein
VVLEVVEVMRVVMAGQEIRHQPPHLRAIMVAQELEIVQIILLEAVEAALEQLVKTHHLLLVGALVVMELHHQLQVRQ